MRLPSIGVSGWASVGAGIGSAVLGTLQVPVWITVLLAVGALFCLARALYLHHREDKKRESKFPGEQFLKRWQAEQERDKALRERNLFTDRERSRRKLAKRIVASREKQQRETDS